MKILPYLFICALIFAQPARAEGDFEIFKDGQDNVLAFKNKRQQKAFERTLQLLPQVVEKEEIHKIIFPPSMSQNRREQVQRTLQEKILLDIQGSKVEPILGFSHVGQIIPAKSPYPAGIYDVRVSKPNV